MVNNFGKLLMEESGQGMAEYSLILAFVALVLIAALGSFRQGIENAYQKTADLFN